MIWFFYRSGHFTSKGGGQQAIGLSSGHYLSVGERRMGTTIGYLRNKTSSSQRQSASTGEGGGLTSSGGSGGTATLTKHEYQSICDEEDEQEESTLRFGYVFVAKLFAMTLYSPPFWDVLYAPLNSDFLTLQQAFFGHFEKKLKAKKLKAKNNQANHSKSH